jgi:hypothetical protein
MKFLRYFLLVVSVALSAQDVLVKRNGQEIKTRIVKIDKKTIAYKDASDPEFNTRTIDKKEVRQIRMEDGKVIDYDRVLPRPYIGLSLGPFSPVGKFGSTDPNNNNGTSGYAEGGGSLNLNAGFYFSRHVGIPIEFQSSRSNYDIESFNEQLESGLSTGFVNAIADPYNFTSLKSGLMYSTCFGKRLTLDLKATVGILTLLERENLAEYGNLFTNTISLTKSTVFKTGFGVSTGGGISLRYSVGKRFAFGLFLDGINANPKILYDRFVEDESALQQDANDKDLEIRQSISGFTGGLLVYWQFNRRKDW